MGGTCVKKEFFFFRLVHKHTWTILLKLGLHHFIIFQGFFLPSFAKLFKVLKIRLGATGVGEGTGIRFLRSDSEGDQKAPIECKCSALLGKKCWPQSRPLMQRAKMNRFGASNSSIFPSLQGNRK